MKKRILSFAISLAMAVTMLSGMAYANEANDGVATAGEAAANSAVVTETQEENSDVAAQATNADKSNQLKDISNFKKSSKPKTEAKSTNLKRPISELKNGISPQSIDYDPDFLQLYTPKDNTVYYKGERITYEFAACDTWENYYTEPDVYLWKINASGPAKWIELVNVSVESCDYYKYSFKLSTSLSAGKYYAGVQLYPVDEYDYLPEDFDDVDYDCPWSESTITIKTLAAPTSVKVKPGKKKATITYKKASGAQKYYIYRSTKKSSGYKCIAKTSSAKYVDKKVKRHKKYYYKVKSVRTSRGTISSSFSSVKSCKTK